jgi:formate hydrogenlyase subunit 3/multisubunit Na+/H+ antiporter MnhD subunit
MIGWLELPWLVASVGAPFALGLAAFLIGRRSHGAVAWIAAVVVPIIAAGLAWQVAARGVVRVAVGGWGRPLGIELQADPLSVLMVVLSAVVGAATCVYARRYFATAGGAEQEAYWPLWLLLWGSLNALFVSADAFNLYVTLELATLASVGLVCVGGGGEARRAAFRYLMVALVGSLAYLAGVGLLYATTGTLDLELIGAALTDSWLATLATAAMLVGLATKAALFPLHFWLPGAHSNAPAPVSAVLSALVVKASFYLVLRLWLDVVPSTVGAAGGWALSLLGAAAVVWGSIQALRAPRLKLLVAYSTVAQIGYLFLVLPLLADGPDRGLVLTGVITFALAHGLAKGAAFMAAGSMVMTVGHDRISGLPGLGGTMPFTLFAFGIAGVSLSGLPPTGGFAAKWLLVSSAIAAGDWFIVIVLVVGGLLAAAYVARVLRAALRTADRETEVVPTRRLALDWPPMVLAVLVLLLGFAVDPMARLIAGGLSAAAGAGGTP